MATPGRLSAEEIAGRGFAGAFRGISETEVRNFLRRIADEFRSLTEQDRTMSARISELETQLAAPPRLTEEQLFDALGQETTRVLRSAQEAATDIRAQALAGATELTDEAEARDREVRDQAARYSEEQRNEADAAAAERERVSSETSDATRAEAERDAGETARQAEADAEAERESARDSGRAMVEEARHVRERVLSDLARRRALMEAQLDELRTGRDRLMSAYRVVKETLADATAALAEVQARAHTADGVEIEPVPEVAGIDVDALQITETETSAAPIPAATSDSEPPRPSTPAEAEQTTTGDGSAGPDSGADASPDRSISVDALFARLKEERVGSADEPAERSDEPAERSDEPAPPSADGSATLDLVEEESSISDESGAEASAKPARRRRRRSRARDEPPTDDPPEIAARDTATAKVSTALARRTKRALQDEQNEALDALRRHRGALTAEDILPSLQARSEAWADVLEPALDELYRAGRRSVQGPSAAAGPGIPRPALATLATTFASALGDHLAGAFGTPDATDEDVAQQLGARYREWRTQQLVPAVADTASAAWVGGSLDGAPPEARRKWITPASGCCPDCDDDALQPTPGGEPFPTGKLSPPAHSGCRCVLGFVAVETASSGPS